MDAAKYLLILFLSIGIAACSNSRTAIDTPAPPADPDADMNAAFTQARDTIDIFIQKIGMPHPNRTYVALKVRFFPPGDAEQDIWVDDVTYEEGVFRGNMGDDIPTLKLVFGERITIPMDSIVDWMIVEDGKLVGGYTIRVAVQHMSPEEKAQFFKTVDYSIDN